MILRGRSSWYGGPTDRGDNNRPALAGATNRTPGIAIYNHSTLGGWWRVKFPNGRALVVQQTDIGPAPWTGKKVDVNPPALQSVGYTTHNYPNPTVTAEYLGKHRPAAGGMAPQAPGRAPTVRPEPAANSFWLGVHQNAARGVPTKVPAGYNYGDVSPQVQQSLWTPQYRAQFAAQGGEQGFRQRELQRALKLRRGR